MKVVWSNPIIWGYKHGYSVDQIATGLMISQAQVAGEILAYEERISLGETLLRRPIEAGPDHLKRLQFWQRQHYGARAALAAIEAERAVPLKAVING